MADLKGMTINERLSIMNEIDDFDSEIRKKNSKTAIAILVRCELPMEAATETVAEILREPQKYGY